MKKTNIHKLPKDYQRLLNVLRDGSENAQSAKELEQILGYTPRQIGSMTADLANNHGYVIGASRIAPFGYYIIQEEADLQSTLLSLNNEINGMIQRHRALNRNFYADELEAEKDRMENI